MPQKEFRIGVLGGKGTGKSYYLQSLISRLRNPEARGAVTAFVSRGEGALRVNNRGGNDVIDAAGFCYNYEHGLAIPQTVDTGQQWLQIQLDYRHGLFAQKKSSLLVDVEDLSGELLHQPLGPSNQAIYDRVCANAAVMVFCFPFWAAFPGPAAMREEAALLAQQFRQVVDNYLTISGRNQLSRKVLPVIVLTMADDERGASADLRANWINRYRNKAMPFELSALQRPGRLCAYLTMARKLSQQLHAHIRHSPNDAAGIRSSFAGSIDKLGKRLRKPWLLPVSAVDGKHVAEADQIPVPIHVELPVLSALCISKNVLL